MTSKDKQTIQYITRLWINTLFITASGTDCWYSKRSNSFSKKINSTMFDLYIESQVLGCNIQGAYPQGVGEAYRQHYPTAGGTGCTCYDHFGAWCVASCAANIRNYEVVSATGTGTFYVSCPAGKVVLGCGMGPSAPTKDLFKTVRITSIADNSCMCYHAYGAPCFATCGQFNWS